VGSVPDAPFLPLQSPAEPLFSLVFSPVRSRTAALARFGTVCPSD
jgi:hypothetical protein